MKFLVAIDGSQASHKALQTAINLAKPATALISVVTILEPLRDCLLYTSPSPRD